MKKESTGALYRRMRHKLRPAMMRVMTPFRGDRVLPDFLIIGAPKSGTTVLFRYLLDHPGVVPPSVKEVNYFGDPRAFRFGERWYRAHFPRVEQMQTLEKRLGYRPLTGEGTPSMFLNAHAINAHALIPQAKLILILRNPTDRAYSQYHHQLRKYRRESLSFWDALQAEDRRISSSASDNQQNLLSCGSVLRRWGYVYRGKYIDQIEHWLKYFPVEQLLILNIADFKTNLVETCNRATDFLGLPRYAYAQHHKLNSGGYREAMEPRCKDFLDEAFRPYNRRLFEFLGEDWGWPT